ncbi:class I SAM-dependent methyltransferase [Mycolicibacterium sediminis]|uniref:Methyltransferase domain-containing protein n=1 Tax=Mycolicibacterium sediminis TaxID=1286180 RepID=A0A7I7QYB3_9MYCO|nr:class I SAM-dependent methyltransferase [Mycolicibacterium sediminis]BBY31318.1 hypothetical protein MSEDJ_54140 [Mycolicibacterium sediminis]
MNAVAPAEKARRAMDRRLKRRAVVKGEITIPAVPHMLHEYVAMCVETFEAVGCAFDPTQLSNLEAILREQLDIAFAASPRSEIVLTYESPIGTAMNYFVRPQWLSLEATYDNWIATREPPLFGTHPDARVIELAGRAPDPREFPILDIGAGTGRNALALARRGHPVDAVEMTPGFAATITKAARQESLRVRVIERDVFASVDELLDDYKLILLSEVVSDFRSPEQVRGVLELAVRCLAPGGHLVFNAFVAADGVVVDEAMREIGQQMYTSIFTREELDAASSSLPIQLIADDSVYDYEHEHLPSEAWPPTSWYADWTTGRDVFDLPREECPIDMRWLVYRRT